MARLLPTTWNKSKNVVLPLPLLPLLPTGQVWRNNSPNTASTLLTPRDTLTLP